MFANWLEKKTTVKVWVWWMKPWLTATADAEKLERIWNQIPFGQSSLVLWMQFAEQLGTRLLPAVLGLHVQGC